MTENARTSLIDAWSIMGGRFLSPRRELVRTPFSPFYQRFEEHENRIFDTIPYSTQDLHLRRETHSLIAVPPVTVAELYAVMRKHFHPGVGEFFMMRDCMREYCSPGWYLFPDHRPPQGEERLPVSVATFCILAISTFRSLRLYQNHSLPTATRLPIYGTVFVGHYDQEGMFFFTGQR
jgi:hypothetical protein